MIWKHTNLGVQSSRYLMIYYDTNFHTRILQRNAWEINLHKIFNSSNNKSSSNYNSYSNFRPTLPLSDLTTEAYNLHLMFFLYFSNLLHVTPFIPCAALALPFCDFCKFCDWMVNNWTTEQNYNFAVFDMHKR